MPKGKSSGNHWGEAAALLETTSRCPYWFNWHDRDRGNTVVFGETGAGKTVLVNALTALSLHFGQRLFFFDKDRGADPFVRAIGGSYTVVRPGHPTGFNPLALTDTPENRDFVRKWLGQILEAKRWTDASAKPSPKQSMRYSSLRHGCTACAGSPASLLQRMTEANSRDVSSLGLRAANARGSLMQMTTRLISTRALPDLT